MKRITIKRQYDLHKDVTFGSIKLSWVAGYKPLHSIELPWLDNKRGISCIPSGVYKCVPYSSAKYKNVWQVLDVPNRTAILIHSGNFASKVKLPLSMHDSDTEGCILVGLEKDIKVPMVQRSKLAMEYLHEMIGKDDFELEIKSV